MLTINRGCATETTGANPVYAVSTCVTIRYPYAWKFSSLIGLFGGRFTLPTAITTTAAALNEN